MTIAKINALIDKPVVAILASLMTSGVAGLLDWAMRVTGAASPVAAWTMIFGCATAGLIFARTLFSSARDAVAWWSDRRKSQTSRATLLPRRFRNRK